MHAFSKLKNDQKLGKRANLRVKKLNLYYYYAMFKSILMFNICYRLFCKNLATSKQQLEQNTNSINSGNC